MALTEIPIELSSTPSIVDGGNATAITIDSSENVTLAGNILHASDLTLDVAGDIILDAGGADIKLNDDGTAVAEINLTGGNLILNCLTSDEDFLVKGNDGGSTIDALVLDMSAAGAATLNNGLTLTDGNVVVAAGHGIDFSATGNISGTSSELLADYEEGTWTPIINGDGGSTSGQSYGSVTAHYVKIGKLVYVGFDVALTENGSIGGNYAVVNNLPFPALNSNLGGGSLGYYRNISNATGPITFYVAASQAYLMKGEDTYVAKTDITNSTRLIGFLSYRTSA